MKLSPGDVVKINGRPVTVNTIHMDQVSVDWFDADDKAKKGVISLALLTDPPATPVLMTKDNPFGWKLEELAAQLREEVKAKSAKLAGVETKVAQTVVLQNNNIVHYLNMIQSAQEKVLAELDKLGPDQGPRGTPRIGAGS